MGKFQGVGVIYAYRHRADQTVYYVGKSFATGKTPAQALTKRHREHVTGGGCVRFEKVLRQMGEESFDVELLHSQTVAAVTPAFKNGLASLEKFFIHWLHPHFNVRHNR